MEYHKPDDTWAALGYNDYDYYVNKCVIKGLFHPVVPKDIVDSYKVAEYMMAFAYYHYPMYDEAAAKIMLIIEYTISRRCGGIFFINAVPAKRPNVKSIKLTER